MFQITNQPTFTHEIKKSTFITNLYKISTIEEANTILANIRKKYYDAKHNCYAIILGTDTINVRSSDDGEPSQTAGKVIYEVLHKNNITNILCVVTRYFGGIKLGSAGLIRAYSQSTIEALKLATLEEIIKKVKLTIFCSYETFDLISRTLQKYPQESKTFSQQISLTYIVPKDEISSTISELISLTKGQIKYETEEII